MPNDYHSLSSLEQEMLAALKVAQRELLECGRQNNDITVAIAKAEPKPHVFEPRTNDPQSANCGTCGHHMSHESHIKPKPRRWVVECRDNPDQDLLSHGAPAGYEFVPILVIREVKPITREAISEAWYGSVRKTHGGGAFENQPICLPAMLRELGIEVEP